MLHQKAAADEDTVQEGQTCLGCNATATPEWRRGPLGQSDSNLCVLFTSMTAYYQVLEHFVTHVGLYTPSL